MSHIHTTLHGPNVGLDEKRRLVSTKGLRLGSDGNQFDVLSPEYSTISDDFNGATIDATKWTTFKGSDGGAGFFASLAGQANGAVRGVAGAGAGATMAVNGTSLVSFLNWKANSGELVFQARVKVDAITNLSLFIGLGEQIAALQQPIVAANGTTVTTTAVDAVGFLFDTTLTAAFWHVTGVANNVDATLTALAVAPVAATYATFRIELDKLGNAKFFYNGRGVAQLALAVTPTVALTPVIAAFTRSASTVNVDADYVHVSATRV